MAGWTWEYIDDYVTLPRFAVLTSHWSRHPTVDMIAAGILDKEAGGRYAFDRVEGPQVDKIQQEEASLNQFLSMCGVMGIPVHRVSKKAIEEMPV